MAEYGYCPSGRLFEAAACGTPLFSDGWEGFETFFTPGEEVLRVDSTEDVLRGLALSDNELGQMADTARARTLEQHTADVRVRELERLCDAVRREETVQAAGASIRAQQRTFAVQGHT